jgi:hypothetical protein
MAYSIANNQLLRKHFAEIQRIIDIPNLIDIQKNSYTSVSCKRSCLLLHAKIMGWKPFSGRFFRFAISVTPAHWNTFHIPWAPQNMTLTNAISEA